MRFHYSLAVVLVSSSLRALFLLPGVVLSVGPTTTGSEYLRVGGRSQSRSSSSSSSSDAGQGEPPAKNEEEASHDHDADAPPPPPDRWPVAYVLESFEPQNSNTNCGDQNTMLRVVSSGDSSSSSDLLLWSSSWSSSTTTTTTSSSSSSMDSPPLPVWVDIITAPETKMTGVVQVAASLAPPQESLHGPSALRLDYTVVTSSSNPDDDSNNNGDNSDNGDNDNDLPTKGYSATSRWPLLFTVQSILPDSTAFACAGAQQVSFSYRLDSSTTNTNNDNQEEDKNNPMMVWQPTKRAGKEENDVDDKNANDSTNDPPTTTNDYPMQLQWRFTLFNVNPDCEVNCSQPEQWNAWTYSPAAVTDYAFHPSSSSSSSSSWQTVELPLAMNPNDWKLVVPKTTTTTDTPVKPLTPPEPVDSSSSTTTTTTTTTTTSMIPLPLIRGGGGLPFLYGNMKHYTFRQSASLSCVSLGSRCFLDPAQFHMGGDDGDDVNDNNAIVNLGGVLQTHPSGYSSTKNNNNNNNKSKNAAAMAWIVKDPFLDELILQCPPTTNGQQQDCVVSCFPDCSCTDYTNQEDCARTNLQQNGQEDDQAEHDHEEDTVDTVPDNEKDKEASMEESSSSSSSSSSFGNSPRLDLNNIKGWRIEVFAAAAVSKATKDDNSSDDEDGGVVKTSNNQNNNNKNDDDVIVPEDDEDNEDKDKNEDTKSSSRGSSSTTTSTGGCGSYALSSGGGTLWIDHIAMHGPGELLGAALFTNSWEQAVERKVIARRQPPTPTTTTATTSSSTTTGIGEWMNQGKLAVSFRTSGGPPTPKEQQPEPDDPNNNDDDDDEEWMRMEYNFKVPGRAYYNVSWNDVFQFQYCLQRQQPENDDNNGGSSMSIHGAELALRLKLVHLQYNLLPDNANNATASAAAAACSNNNNNNNKNIDCASPPPRNTNSYYTSDWTKSFFEFDRIGLDPKFRDDGNECFFQSQNDQKSYRVDHLNVMQAPLKRVTAVPTILNHQQDWTLIKKYQIGIGVTRRSEPPAAAAAASQEQEQDGSIWGVVELRNVQVVAGESSSSSSSLLPPPPLPVDAGSTESSTLEEEEEEDPITTPPPPPTGPVPAIRAISPANLEVLVRLTVPFEFALSEATRSSLRGDDPEDRGRMLLWVERRSGARRGGTWQYVLSGFDMLHDEKSPEIISTNEEGANGLYRLTANMPAYGLFRWSVEVIPASNSAQEKVVLEKQYFWIEEAPTLSKLIAMIGELSFFRIALGSTQLLLDEIDNPSSRPYTVFAPTNAAFAQLGEETVNLLLNSDQGLETLEVILLNHVIEGAVYSSKDFLSWVAASDTSNNNPNGNIQTAAKGSYLHIFGNATNNSMNNNNMNNKYHQDDLWVQSLAARTEKVMNDNNNYKQYPKIIVRDIHASNGIIHLIDALMNPYQAKNNNNNGNGNADSTLGVPPT